MRYINQLDYRHIVYRTNIAKDIPEEQKIRNIALSGCGLASACMVLDFLTDKSVTLEECVEISDGCGANRGSGTAMKVFAPVFAEKYDLAYSSTDDLDEAIRHLQSGGAIIAHMGVPEGKEIGLFTKGGHYIALISTDGKEFCILDPSYTKDKFEIPERQGRVNTDNAPYLYCDVNIVDSETKPGKIKYHLFGRRR